jgi:hypothetical protein
MHIFLLDKPEVTLTKDELDKLGVLSWIIPVETIEQDGILDKICQERKYTYKDIVRSLELSWIICGWPFGTLSLPMEDARARKLRSYNNVLAFSS